MWSPGQQQQHHLETCKTREFSGSTLDLLKQNLWDGPQTSVLYSNPPVDSDSRSSVWITDIKFMSHITLCCCLVVSDCFVVPWTIAYQAPLPRGFPRQEYWSGLPFSSPGDLPDPGIEPTSPALADEFFTTEPPGKPHMTFIKPQSSEF